MKEMKEAVPNPNGFEVQPLWDFASGGKYGVVEVII